MSVIGRCCLVIITENYDNTQKKKITPVYVQMFLSMFCMIRPIYYLIDVPTIHCFSFSTFQNQPILKTETGTYSITYFTIPHV